MIKTEELKMYQGTGLLMQNKMGFKLKFNGLDTTTRRVRLNMDWYTERELSRDGITPVVKPLSEIKPCFINECCECDHDSLEYALIHNKISYDELTLRTTNMLAAEHYDIFGWLNNNIKDR